MLSLAALILSTALPLAGQPVASPSPAPSAPKTPPAEVAPAGRFGDEIAVRLFSVMVRVVDGQGHPITGLTPADFRLRVGKQEVTVTAVDWYTTTTPPTPPLASASLPEAGAATAPDSRPPAAPATPGKLVVIFVEADNNEPGRTRGHLRTLPFTDQLLASLAPDDRVAVVSFDSHLKLWQDFTRDREPVHNAIYNAIAFGGQPPALPATDPDALAAHFDLAKAQEAASPERALALTADSLAAFSGEKILVFLGWGLGNFSSFGTQMTPAFAPAVRALKAAHVAVFVLDVTEADSHDLEVGLESVAEETGGTYDKTFHFPGLAVAQLANTISGYYILSLDPETVPRDGGRVTAELRDRKGTVLLRPLAIRR